MLDNCPHSYRREANSDVYPEDDPRAVSVCMLKQDGVECGAQFDSEQQLIEEA